jgi:hypothetical protein
MQKAAPAMVSERSGFCVGGDFTRFLVGTRLNPVAVHA